MTKTQNATATQLGPCSRCKLSNCPGPDNCLVDCLTCDDSEDGTAHCEADGCSLGYLLDAQGIEYSVKCKVCKGKGRVRCPDC